MSGKAHQFDGHRTVSRWDPRVTSCITRTAFRYASGHIEGSGEQPALDTAEQAARQQGFNFRALLTEIVASDAFRYARRP